MRRRFPERQILVRAEGRVSYITLSHRLQLTMVALGIAGAGAIAYVATGGFHVSRGVPGIDQLAVQTAAPTAQLQAEIEELQKKLAAANAELTAGTNAPATTATASSMTEVQARIAALESARDQALAEQHQLQQQLEAAQQAANTKSQNLAQLNHALDANRGESRQWDAQRNTLVSRLRQLESELESANARAGQYKTDLASNERKLQQLAAEHDKTLAERDRLQARLAELQARLAVPSAPNAANAAVTPGIPASPPRAAGEQPADQRSDNRGHTNELERLIASTGMDVEKLLARFPTVPQGQGGPYVAVDSAVRSATADARLEKLEKIVKTLPLAEPLPHYQFESGFGVRADPFHGHQAFHAGVDLSAPYRSPVFSTGPGVVLYTGVRGEYGKVVEIDHGHGIVTRYAHLHRYVVAMGQKITVHQQVGELGSTGRSTGPHLHYEVLVDGTATNPEKFMRAGKNVVQTSGN